MPETTIGPNRFTVVALPAMQTCELEPIVFPLLPDIAALYALLMESAPAIATAFGGVDKEVNAESVSAAVPSLLPILDRASEVIARLARKFPPGALSALTRELLRGARCDGQELFGPAGEFYNVAMQGRTIDAWRLRLFALRVNFPDVFKLVPGASGSAARTPAAPSAESST